MKLVKDINKDSSNKPQVSDKEAEEAIKKLLAWIGEDPSREGLIETPKRVVKAFKEYFKGYNQNAEEDLSKTFGDVEGYDDMVFQLPCHRNLRRHQKSLINPLLRFDDSL